jgi:hypothetical protein
MLIYNNELLRLDRAASECELIASVKEGDKDAFGVLYETHMRSLEIEKTLTT